ncbi:MAG: response regulator [Mycobacteriales bacterium]
MGADEQLQHRLRALFAEELDDGLQLLGAGLLRLEQDAGKAPGADLVQELFRTAHSLKGAAHAASVPEAVEVCDRLESTFAAVRDGELHPDSALVTRLLGETDTLSALAAGLHEVAAAPADGPPTGGRSAGPEQPARAQPPHPEPAPAQPAPAQPAPAEPVSVPAQPAASLRVSADKLDAVLRRAGEGLVATRRLHEVADQAAHAAERVEAARSRLRAALRQERAGSVAHSLDTLLDDAARAVTTLARSVEVTDRALEHTSAGVAEAAQSLRTQPFADACGSLDRVVRDVATTTGKAARFELVGGDIDVDRGVIAALRDPLLHLVRNAVDHGLEQPAGRAAAGKSTTGTVSVVATLDGSMLHVTVRDDGAGIDARRLREAAERRGLAAPDDDMELAFVPGLSSRADVTAVSGRGVGLDAARARLEQLGGNLQVVSQPDVGTEVRLTTPVTLAVLRVLLVRTGGQTVAVPTASVDRVVQVERQALREVEGSVLLTLGDRSVRAVSLSGALGFGDQALDDGDLIGVIVPRGGDVVLVVDALLDEFEVAVEPVPARLAGAPGLLGVIVVQGDLPAVVVNPVAVGRTAAPLVLATASAAPTAAARILLAEDTVTTRALERSILEAAGYSVAVAVDGADAWEQLQADGADLVVSDVDMPRMSGIDLCRRIRSSTRLRELPVVLVTSLDTAADRQRGLEAGADAYVVKGEFQQGTLLDTIARLL